MKGSEDEAEIPPAWRLEATQAQTGPGSVQDLPTAAGSASHPSDRSVPEWAALALSEPGRQVGPFILGDLIGKGGMGLVYRAFDPSLRRVVALKLVRSQEPLLLARFQQEARAQAKVDHPNICKVYEVGQVDDQPYIAMQFIEGGDLVDRGGALSLEEKVRIIILAADALEAAHRAGLIHRDIKPSNIMLEQHGDGWTPFVMDFGLAKEQESAPLTMDDQVLGTPAYMAPEQALGWAGRVDARTDVYALGATFYFLLANRPPFKETNAARTLVALAGTEAPNLHKLVPGLPLDLAIIVHKCLDKEPDRRYASARLLAEDLRRFTQGEPILARPPSLGYRLGKKIRKHKAATLVITLAAVLAVGATGWSVRMAFRARAQAELARRFGEQVKELEWSMRVAHLLPCHDLGRDLGRVQATMESLRRQLEAQPEGAGAAGFYALGRGYLAMGNYPEACRHLQKAWAMGARGPQVAEALGSVLGERYCQGLEDAGRESSDARLARQAALVRDFRTPALEYIRLAGDSPYLKGLMAFYEGRHADAARLAQAALAADPASFEALKLQGDAASAEAQDAFEHGLAREAAAANARAAQAYGAALDIARSHPALWLAEAKRCLLTLRLSTQKLPAPGQGALEARGDPDARAFRDALRMLDRARTCEPGASAVELAEAQAWAIWAEELRRQGRSPLAANGKALEAARRAALTDPGPAPLIVMASLMRSNGEYVRYHGGDPDPWILEAAGQFRQAVRLEPDNTTALRGHLLLCFVAADHARRRGLDPRATVEEGQVLGARLVALQPGLASNYNWLGGLVGAQAEYLLDHGRDPSQAFQRSLDAFAKALAINPQDPALMNNLGYYTARYAEAELQAGHSGASPSARALDQARRALLLNPDSALFYGTFALTCRIRAEQELRAGGDPTAFLQEGLAACRKGQKLDPGFYDNPLQAGLLGLVKVRWLVAGHGAPKPSITSILAQALADLTRARALNTLRGWETEVAMARGLLLEAELAPDQAPALRATARQLLDRVARRDPGLAPMRLLRDAIP